MYDNKLDFSFKVGRLQLGNYESDSDKIKQMTLSRYIVIQHNLQAYISNSLHTFELLLTYWILIKIISNRNTVESLTQYVADKR